jgi:hypothetical protein
VALADVSHLSPAATQLVTELLAGETYAEVADLTGADRRALYKVLAVAPAVFTIGENYVDE